MDGDKSVTAVFEDGTNPPPPPGDDEIHNFTESGINSSFFNISGNLSTSKGTVNYEGLTLTQCLKIESSTSISFTSAQESTLILVFNEGWSGDFVVDGTSRNVSGGILTIDLAAGAHSLSKGDVANLYYMRLSYNGTPPTQYTLSTTTNGQGTVTGAGTYNEGSVVTLSATPASGWQVDSWSGVDASNGNTATVTMNSNKSVSVTFTEIPPNYYTLTTSVNGQGTVTGAGTYLEGTVVTLNASAASGWVFSSWSGVDASNGTSATVTMNSNRSVTATFIEETGECTWVEYQDDLGEMSSGSFDNNNAGFTGNGFANTSNSTGVWYQIDVNVPSAGTHPVRVRYANGSSDRPAEVSVDGSSQVSSQNFPSTGSWTTWEIVEFSLNLNAGTNTIRLTALTSGGLANLDRIDVCQGGSTPTQYTLSASVNGQGTVSGAGTYAEGTVVSVTATPAAGWQFDGWSGDAGGTANPVSITMDANKSVTANFSEIPPNNYTLTTSVNGQGTVSGAGTYVEGTVVSVSATPDAGWIFDSWNGDASGSDNPLSLTMNADKSITANFIESTGPVTLTLQENEDGFCSVDGDVEDEHSGHTGTGYANTDNENGNGITWSVNVPAAGTYSFVWRFANGASSDRTAQLMENGTTIVSGISMPSTGAWNSWAETSAINASLSAGTLLLRLQATTSSGLANIDYMEITGEGLTAVACPGLKSTQSITGAAENNSEVDVNVFPNPVNTTLNFGFNQELSEEVTISLFDMTAKLVKSFQTSGMNYSLDMSGLLQGIYLVKISGADLNKVMHIIKK